jgi:electron transfer flavoprotein alpha subunit
VLVAGVSTNEAAQDAASVSGVAKVLSFEHLSLQNKIAETLAAALVQVIKAGGE